jgi:hypothetical protein
VAPVETTVAVRVDPSRRAPRWRRVTAASLVVAGCVLAPVTLVTVWLHGTLLDTDQYVATVGPLASDSSVQQALATRVSKALVTSTGLERRIAGALPPDVAFIAPFVTSGAGSLVHGVALEILQSRQFEQLWRGLNRRAHRQVVAVLRGQTQGVSTGNGQVAIDLKPIAREVTKRLDGLGIHALDQQVGHINQRVVLFDSPELRQAQGVVRVFDDLVVALPVITVVGFAGALAVSPDRRRTLARAAFGLVLATALLLTVFNVARSVYLNVLPGSVDRSAAAAVFDQLVSFLLLTLRSVFSVAAGVMVAAWLGGPGRVASRVRAVARDVVGAAPARAPVSPAVARWVAGTLPQLRVAVGGVGLLMLVVLDHPGPVTVLIVAVLVLAGLGALEVLGRGAGGPRGARAGAG